MLEAEDQEIESGLLDRENGGVGDERRLHLVRCGSFGGVDRFHGTHADDGRWAHGRRGLLFSQKQERARVRAVVGRGDGVGYAFFAAGNRDTVDAL